MRKKTIVLAACCLVTLVGCGREAPSGQSATPVVSEAFKPVATVKQVMLGITVPASNVVFAVAGEAPASDETWQAVEASALAVAESGNLLLMQPRAVDEHEWRQFALALIDAGAGAAAAARAKDVEKTGIAGDDMYTVCEQCHEKYLPKAPPASP